jgi:hypothetical protein
MSCIAILAFQMIMSGVQFGIVESDNSWLKYAMLTLLNSGVAVQQSINDAWFSVNTPDAQERCVGLVLAVA